MNIDEFYLTNIKIKKITESKLKNIQIQIGLSIVIAKSQYIENNYGKNKGSD